MTLIASIATGGIAIGGKAIYGAPLGILMLEARFPRIPGDMGNAATWPFPVLYRVVKGASPERVVLQGAATVAFEDRAPMTLAPGDVVRLHAGQRTVWTVTQTLRKVYMSLRA